MDRVQKFKEWMNENLPTFTILYENKYVGMAYDRFASLHPRQQKQAILGAIGGVLFILILYIFASYLSLWSLRGTISDQHEMITLLQQFQMEQRNRSGDTPELQQSALLSRPGQLRSLLLRQGQRAAISPRLIKVEEKPDSIRQGEEGRGDVKMKQATVTLERVNLNQLKAFLSALEFGEENLSISSIKISNDDKIRGYMNVDMGVVAYLIGGSEGGEGE